jgi:hypothetical protein
LYISSPWRVSKSAALVVSIYLYLSISQARETVKNARLHRLVTVCRLKMPPHLPASRLLQTATGDDNATAAAAADDDDDDDTTVFLNERATSKADDGSR